MFYIFLSLFFVFSCHKEFEDRRYVIFLVVGDVYVNGKAAQLDYVFKVGDEVEVKKDSELVIVVYGKGTIKVVGESKFKFDEIQSLVEGNKNDTISLLKGKLFSKVEGIFSDENNLNIKTESAFVTVRGTIFMVRVVAKDTEIKVNKGRVYVAPNVGNKELSQKIATPVSGGVIVRYEVKLKVQDEILKGNLDKAKAIYQEEIDKSRIKVDEIEFEEIEKVDIRQEKGLEKNIQELRKKKIKKDVMEEKGLFDETKSEERLEKNIKELKEKKGMKRNIIKEKDLFEEKDEEKSLEGNLESLKKKLKK